MKNTIRVIIAILFSLFAILFFIFRDDEVDVSFKKEKEADIEMDYQTKDGKDDLNNKGYTDNQVNNKQSNLSQNSDKIKLELNDKKGTEQDIENLINQIYAQNDLKLKLVTYQYKFDGQSSYIEGQLKNDSNKSYSFVQITINLYDKDKNIVETIVDSINRIERDDFWNFEVSLPTDDFIYYDISKIEGN